MGEWLSTCVKELQVHNRYAGTLLMSVFLRMASHELTLKPLAISIVGP